MKKIIAILLAVFAVAGVQSFAATVQQGLRFGIRVTPDQWATLEETLKNNPADPDNPVGVFIVLPAKWTVSPMWNDLDAVLAAAKAAHAEITLCTQIPASPGERSVVRYLAELSGHTQGRADVLALSLNKETFSKTLRERPDKLALVLKEMMVALRGESDARILIGDVQPEDLPLMKPLYARNFRAYVEGYCSSTTDPAGEPADEVVRFLESYHLGAPLLLNLPPAQNAIAAQLLILVSASRGITYTDISGDVETVWKALLDLRSRLSRAMAPGFSNEGTEIDDASGPRPDVGIINLLDGDKMVQALALVPRIAGSKRGMLLLHLSTGDVTDPRYAKLPFGKTSPLGYDQNQKAQTTVLRVPWTAKPLLVLFDRLRTGTVGRKDVVIRSNYHVPVEFIIARHQAVQKFQNIFLEHYARKAQVDYHFKLPGGTGSLDVTFMNTFFYEKGIGARWVQNQLLLNGVAWKGKLPELPIIEPEKVNTLPLALTLGRDYSYKYVKDEAIEGHNCYVIEFFPLPTAKGSLYSGRIWIDKKTYAKIRMSVSQTNLKPPMVSSEETDYYDPIIGQDGKKYWLLSHVKGQQIFSMGGKNVAAERVITFGKPEVNKASFHSKVEKAKASDKLILQETDKGLRYLVKQKDGTRKIRMNQKSSRLLAAAGFYYDSSLDFPLPLAGFNYFNYDWKKTGTQINMLVAGAVNTLTVSKVNLLPKVDGSLNAILFTIPMKDLYYPSGVEDKSQRVKILRENGYASLGWRFNQFSKLSLNLGTAYYGFSRDSKTSDLFRLPEDHFDTSVGLSSDFLWKGFSLSASYNGHHRSSWKRWGLPGSHRNFDRFKDYSLWDLSLGKTFYLPYFQKIGTSVRWMDGRDLDRFSKYQFTYMGPHSLSGFAGSGVRFDRGAIASVIYQFNIEKVVRFGARVDHARVQPRRETDIWQNHTGIALNAGMVGPWKTYWTLDVGYAVKSDIPAAEHDSTVALLVVKLW